MRRKRIKAVAPRKRSKRRRLSPAEFTLLALKKLAPEPGRGIHVVYSGFNEAFRQYFPASDVVSELERLAAEGVISLRPVEPYRRYSAYPKKPTRASRLGSGNAPVLVVGTGAFVLQTSKSVPNRIPNRLVENEQ